MTISRRLFCPLLALAVLLAGGCTKQLREHHVLSKAKSAFEAEQYDQAEADCHKALMMAPKDPAAIRQLGLIFFAEGRLNEAHELLKTALVTTPQDPELQVKFALTELNLGRRTEARAEAKAVLSEQPDNEDAVMLIAESSSSPALIEESRQFLQKLVATGKDQASYHVALAILKLLQRDLTGAEPELKRALTLDPKSSAAYYETAGLDLLRHDEAAAGPAMKQAAELSPLRSARRLRWIEFELHLKAEADAKRDLAEINTKAPDYIPAWVLGMKLAYSERRFDDARAMVDQILRRDPYNYDGLLELGTLDLEKGDAAAAINVLKRADHYYSRTPAILYELALAYDKKADTANAESCLNQAVLLAPNFDGATLLLADIEIGKGDLAAAAARLTAVIKARPKTIRAYLLLARDYHAAKQPDQALAVYHQAELEFPKDPEIPFRRGALLNQLGRRPEARQAFAQALGIVPAYTPALEMLVDLDLAARNYGGAEDRINAFIAQFPKMAGPYVLRAKVHLAKRQLGPAETDLLQAIDADPNGQSPYLLLARIYIASDKPQQAVDKLNILAAKGSVPALMQLGILQTQLKHYAEAQADYERLLKINPQFTTALNNLAYLNLENLGHPDLAEKFAQKAMDLAPDNPATADTMGWVLYREGKYRNALTLLQRAAEGAPTDAEIQYHLGMANYMLGAEEPARLALHQAVTASTDFVGKDDARQELAILAIDPAMPTANQKTELADWLRSHPKDPIAALRVAAVESHSGSATTAAAGYEATLKLNPQDAKTMLELADLYAGPLHRPDRARTLAKNAHELAPNDAPTSAALGQLLYGIGDYAWSLTLLQEATRGNASPPDVTYELARGFYAVGQVAQAQSTLQDLLASPAPFPARAEAEHLAALVSAAQSPASAQAALETARQALRGDPKSIPALMVVALAREQAGDYPAAAQDYEKLLADDPAFGPASRRLALLYLLQLHDDRKAGAVAEHARAGLPDDPDILKTLGVVAYRRGDYTAAVSALARSLSARADDAEAVYYSGMAHYKLKDRGTALTELEHALDLNLTGPNADEAKRAVAQIQAAIRAESSDTAAPAGSAN